MSKSANASQPESGAGDPMSEGTSAAWIRRIKKDPDAQTVWGALTDRYKTRILVYAAQRLGPNLRRRHQPEEIVNEAWMRVFQNVGRFEYRHRGSLYSWLCLQVSRVVVDLGRSDDRHPQVASLDAGPSSEASSGGGRILPANDAHSPASVVALRDVKDRLTDALESVPSIYRDVLIAFYLEDKSREEIARLLDRKPNTITQQLKRGKELWRDAYGSNIDTIL